MNPRLGDALSALCSLLVAAAAAAQEQTVRTPPQTVQEQGAPQQKATGLLVGHPAPKRIEVAHWIRARRPVSTRLVLHVFWSAPDDVTGQTFENLSRLQERFKEKGLAITAIGLPSKGITANQLVEQLKKHQDQVAFSSGVATSGKAAGRWLGVQVVTLLTTDPGRAELPRGLVVRDNVVTWIGDPRRNLRTVLERELAIVRDRELLERIRATQNEINTAEARRDWKTMVDIANELVAIGARNAYPWMTRFRAHQAVKKDDKKARGTAVAALKDLAWRPDQLVQFINRCLLSHKKNVFFYQLSLMALTPAAAQAPKNVDVQMAYARALAGCGNVKQAKVVAGRLVPLLGDNPQKLKGYAEQLASSHHPTAFGNVARTAIDRAIGQKKATRDLLMVKFLVLEVCERDPQSAHDVGRKIIASMGNNNGTLNSFAWDLLTEHTYKGKYSSLALIATDQMEKNGQAITYYMLDTIALAKFENGLIDEAIDFQSRAIAGGGRGDAEYHLRMEMYKKAQRERDLKRARPGKNTTGKKTRDKKQWVCVEPAVSSAEPDDQPAAEPAGPSHHHPWLPLHHHSERL